VNTKASTMAEVKAIKTLSTDFLQRYNKSGPRYTSYPTAPEWKESVNQDRFRQLIHEEAEQQSSSPLSLYFHIPFCEHRCRFCGCNTIITTKKEVAEEYLRSLDAEMAIVAGEMESAGTASRPVTQIHFGGGTPTFLTPQQFIHLMKRIRNYFTITDDAEISLEADPCVTTDEHVQTLAEIGFNRISYGVQDFHPPTQEIIERVQSVELTQHLTEVARECGFESVNYDLVYGLPLQNHETFAGTLDRVIELKPDRIALYNFAYLPSRLSNQRALDPGIMPSGPEKFKVFISAYERFLGEGFEFIGMDHFAGADDPLSEARRKGTLQRNFMGYTTQAGTDMYAFGVSSISATHTLYVQSTKKLSAYHKAIAAGRLPIERGIVLSDDDVLRKEVIYSLMCYGGIDKTQISDSFDIDFDIYFAEEIKQLPPFEEDGLMELTGEGFQLTLLGNIFVRNIAMVFDKYLRAPKKQPTFSRTL
jgi:oxygen-independent coproporphyrinogen-3 oxidase